MTSIARRLRGGRLRVPRRAPRRGCGRGSICSGSGPGARARNLRLIDTGAYPWWMAPDFKLHFVRPLSSLLFTLEHAVFGDRPLGYHLVSIALYLALLLTVSKIFCGACSPAPRRRSRGSSPRCERAHVLPYAWLCAQHMLVGVTPADASASSRCVIRAETRGVEAGAASRARCSSSSGSPGARRRWRSCRVVGRVRGRKTVAGRRATGACAARECAGSACSSPIYLAVYHRGVGGGTRHDRTTST